MMSYIYAVMSMTSYIYTVNDVKKTQGSGCTKCCILPRGIPAETHHNGFQIIPTARCFFSFFVFTSNCNTFCFVTGNAPLVLLCFEGWFPPLHCFIECAHAFPVFFCFVLFCRFETGYSLLEALLSSDNLLQYVQVFNLVLQYLHSSYSPPLLIL